ncbi:MAG: TraB/GumN family protein [Syntrophorhabdaceae bacterium]|nr:TraB/GumN family protein [Syntrophorhabdaceae bacterium]
MVLEILKEKTFRMAWTVQKGDKIGYLAGTAHFFPYSFKRSLKRLIEKTKIVLLEGPLDERSMENVRKYGLDEKESLLFLELLERETVEKMNRIFEKETPESLGSLMGYINRLTNNKELRLHPEIRGLKPWMTFFRTWSQYLRNRGWKFSVDMEAYEVAKSLGKEIHFIETIEEQIKALEGIPTERILNFLKKLDTWDTYTKRHVKYYLAGDYEGIRGLITEYPTRCESIIDRRDPVMFERIIPYMERGGAIAFVGTSHVFGIKKRLEDKGFTVNKYEG